MRIRLGTLEDVKKIMKIVEEVIIVMQGIGNYQWDYNYPLPETFTNDVKLFQLWVCEDDETIVDTWNERDIVGFAALTTDQPDEYNGAGCDTSDISIVPHRIAIDPKYQRKGISNLFLFKAEELAKERNYKYVRIDTCTINIPMNKAISNCGYIFKGEITLGSKLSSSGDGNGLRYNCYEKEIM